MLNHMVSSIMPTPTAIMYHNRLPPTGPRRSPPLRGASGLRSGFRGSGFSIPTARNHVKHVLWTATPAAAADEKACYVGGRANLIVRGTLSVYNDSRRDLPAATGRGAVPVQS